MRTSALTWLRTLCVLALVGALALPGAAGGAVAQASEPAETTSNATIELSEADGTVGETVTVELRLTGENIANYQTAIRYDPAVVSFEAASGGSFATPQVADDAGLVQLTQSNSEAVGSDIVAATLTFEIEQAGETTLSIVEGETLVGTEELTRLQTSASDGQITATKDKSGSSGGIAAPPVGGDTPSDEGSADGSSDQSDSVGATDTDGQTAATNQSADEKADTDEQQASDDDDATSTESDENENSAAATETAESESSDDSSSDSIPGFGFAAGAVLLLTAGLLARRR